VGLIFPLIAASVDRSGQRDLAILPMGHFEKVPGGDGEETERIA